MDEHTVEGQLDRLSNVGAVQQDFYGCYGYYCNFPASYKNAWVLPAGWDKLSDLKADEIAQDSEGVVVQQSVFYGFNLAFLVVGIVGWLALIGGLVLGIVFGGGGGGGDAAEK
jgi:ABC-type dipeptide/oligopeptide/nickel transport system permease subunit